MFDYHATRTATLEGASHIGRAITAPAARRLMSPTQERRSRAANFMTNEIWGHRLLAGGAVIAEISYGYFMDAPLLGLTVFCVGALAADASEWDHTLGGCFRDPTELHRRLEELNTGARDRLQSLHNAA